MNALVSLFAQLVGFALALTIMICGLMFIANRSDLAKGILKWESKKLAHFGRWLLKHAFHALGNFFHYLAKECGKKKNNNNPNNQNRNP